MTVSKHRKIFPRHQPPRKCLLHTVSRTCSHTKCGSTASKRWSPPTGGVETGWHWMSRTGLVGARRHWCHMHRPALWGLNGAKFLFNPMRTMSLEHPAFIHFWGKTCEQIDGERLLDPIFHPNIHTSLVWSPHGSPQHHMGLLGCLQIPSRVVSHNKMHTQTFLHSASPPSRLIHGNQLCLSEA